MAECSHICVWVLCLLYSQQRMQLFPQELFIPLQMKAHGISMRLLLLHHALVKQIFTSTCAKWFIPLFHIHIIIYIVYYCTRLYKPWLLFTHSVQLFISSPLVMCSQTTISDVTDIIIIDNVYNTFGQLSLLFN